MGRGLVVLAMAGTIAAMPGTASAATVTFHPSHDVADPGPGEDNWVEGSVEVRDSGREDNDIEVRVTKRLVTIVEHGRPSLEAGHNCHARSPREVFCRAPDTPVVVHSGRGRDTVRGHCHTSSLRIAGGPGADRLFQGDCGGPVWGGQGDDLLVGGSNADQLRGGGGNDRLRGRGGNDILYGDGSAKAIGDDSLDGGKGRDTAAWDERSHDIRADLRRGIEQSPEDRDTLRGIENLVGGTGDDTLAGDGHANRLRGAGGTDELIGRGGDDILDGGFGSLIYSEVDDGDPDVFSCGSGQDLVVWPGHTVLPWGCERMRDDFYFFFNGDAVRVRPRPVGAHAVAVPVVCDPTTDGCRRRVTITSNWDGLELGRTELVSDPPAEMRVKLRRAADRDASVTIVVSGDDLDSDPDTEGDRVPYRFTWRVGCAGAPRRDVCSLGAR